MSKRSASEALGDPEALGDSKAEEKKEICLMDLAIEMVEQDVQDFQNSFEDRVSKFRKKRQEFYTNIVHVIRTVRNGNLEKGDEIYWSWLYPTEEELSIFSKLTGRIVTCQTKYGEISNQYYIRIGQTLQEEKEEKTRKKNSRLQN